MLLQKIAIGDLVVKFQNIIDRKIFIETQLITPELAEVTHISKKKWNTLIKVKSTKKGTIYSASLDCFRRPTKQELFFYELEKKLPELINVFN